MVFFHDHAQTVGEFALLHRILRAGAARDRQRRDERKQAAKL
jgi:hypothetical protein